MLDMLIRPSVVNVDMYSLYVHIFIGLMRANFKTIRIIGIGNRIHATVFAHKALEPNSIKKNAPNPK